MTAKLLDGKTLADSLQYQLKRAIIERSGKGYPAPGLAVILIGSNPASGIYVNNKRKACSQAGIESWAFNLPADTSEAKLVELIHQLNADERVDGILVQLPLPEHIATLNIIEAIKPSKDVDGFHPYNQGRLMQKLPTLRPCTPYGIIQLLEAFEIPLRGRDAVVVGVSNIVGRPMALEFLLAGATVTCCHRLTQNLQKYIRDAEIVVVATGVQDVVPASWLHKNQVVVDVGIHRLADGRLRGDIDFEEAKQRVAWLTPVPGGVGPMTVATLLQNTLKAQIERFARF